MTLMDYEKFARVVLWLRGRGLQNTAVFSALEQVPRALFLRPAEEEKAYETGIFPIECGQFIESLDQQLLLIEALDVKSCHRVLEIGTGSGFTAAILAKLAEHVTTVERYRTLVEHSKKRFEKLRIYNILAEHNDSLNDLAVGPFDRIIVWGSFDRVPQDLLEQLTIDGLLLTALGPACGQQQAVLYSRHSLTDYSEKVVCSVRYLPLLKGRSQRL